MNVSSTEAPFFTASGAPGGRPSAIRPSGRRTPEAVGWTHGHSYGLLRRRSGGADDRGRSSPGHPTTIEETDHVHHQARTRTASAPPARSRCSPSSGRSPRGPSLSRHRLRVSPAARPAMRTAAPASAAGSSVRPVWIADGWMIVDDGALSQPKRSDGCSAARAPAAGSPPAMSHSACRCGRTSCGSSAGAIAASRAASSADARGEEVALAAVDDHAGIDALAARQARHDTHDHVLELSGHHAPPPARAPPRALGLGHERARRRAGARRRSAARSARRRRRVLARAIASGTSAMAAP